MSLSCQDGDRAGWHHTIARFTPPSQSRVNSLPAGHLVGEPPELPLARHVQSGAIRRNVFKTLGALIEAIESFLAAWNDAKKLFVWVKSAEQILARLHRQPS
jgi:hypothetical protein